MMVRRILNESQRSEESAKHNIMKYRFFASVRMTVHQSTIIYHHLNNDLVAAVR